MNRGFSSRKKPGVTRCGDAVFDWGARTYIMGIVNLSPDSFSGDGLKSIDDALAQAVQMVKDGADIIDVGGESTRPDSKPVSAEEEIKRVIPFIKEAAKAFSAPVSVDTYKVEVARQAVKAGARIINDISGLRVEPDLLKVAAGNDAILVLTSNERGRTVTNIMETVIASLQDQIQRAVKAGISRPHIIVDPGIGFGKTVQQNLEIMNRLDEMEVLEQPVLIGTSRKSFIGSVLDLPGDQRFEGTAATIAIGIAGGADIVRVHDVKQMKLVCMMSDAICRSGFKT